MNVDAKRQVTKLRQMLMRDSSKEGFLMCCQVNVIGNDLVPLMTQIQNEGEYGLIFSNCLEVVNVLTRSNKAVFDIFDFKLQQTTKMIHERNEYLRVTLKDFGGPSFFPTLANFLDIIINGSSSSFSDDDKIGIESGIFKVVKNVLNLFVSLGSPNDALLDQEKLVERCIDSKILQKMYKIVRKNGTRQDMYSFVVSLGGLVQNVELKDILLPEQLKKKERKAAEVLSQLPMSEKIKELTKTVLSDNKPKSVSIPNDPLLALVREGDAKRINSRYRAMNHGRYQGAYVAISPLNKSMNPIVTSRARDPQAMEKLTTLEGNSKPALVREGDAKRINSRYRAMNHGRYQGAYVAISPLNKSMNPIVTSRARDPQAMEKLTTLEGNSKPGRNPFKSANALVKSKPTLSNESNAKIYDLIRWLMLESFDLRRCSYSDFHAFSTSEKANEGAEVHYLRIQSMFLKFSRLERSPWLYINDFMTVESITDLSERLGETIDDMEKDNMDVARERVYYMVLVLKEAISRLPQLKERSKEQYYALVYYLYYEDYPKNIVKYFTMMDDNKISRKVLGALFSVILGYFKVLKFVKDGGGWTSDFAEGIENPFFVPLESEEIYQQLIQYKIARWIRTYLQLFYAKLSFYEVHNIVSLIYVTTAKMTRMQSYFRVSFMILLRQWIYKLKTEPMTSPKLMPVQMLADRLVILFEEAHVYGLDISGPVRQIVHNKKGKKAKKAKKQKDPVVVSDNELSDTDEGLQKYLETIDKVDQMVVDEDGSAVMPNSNTGLKKIPRKKRVVVADDDNSDGEVPTFTSPDGLSDKNGSMTNGKQMPDLSGNELEIDSEKDNYSSDDYEDTDIRRIPVENFSRITTAKRPNLFEDSDDEESSPKEPEFTRPQRKRARIIAEDDE
uniref:TIMELESS domain-containing protein n=1 Tax=Rhabditophanes sp. KR3021 TaxID=114890 RepID=A0AC35TMI8_9BILA